MFHEGQHQFICGHEIKSIASDIIDIVFCIDTTGSMGKYIRSTRDTVKNLVK